MADLFIISVIAYMIYSSHTKEEWRKILDETEEQLYRRISRENHKNGRAEMFLPFLIIYINPSIVVALQNQPYLLLLLNHSFVNTYANCQYRQCAKSFKVCRAFAEVISAAPPRENSGADFNQTEILNYSLYL